MARLKIPIHSYNLPSRVPARLVNTYAQQTVSVKGVVELLSAPGVVSWATCAGPGRGLFVMKDTLYAVGGGSLYQISASGTATNLGTVSGNERLTITGNGSAVVTSNKAYWDGTTMATITDADAPEFAVVDFVDGYILAAEAGTGRFVGSALNDASDWDALDYATAEGSPDNLISLIVDHRQALLMGTDSIEIWWNSGISGFPFERLAGGYLEIGCLAKLGRCKADNSVFWLASDRTIRRLTGSTPVRVSQHGVEEAIASYASVSDCVAYSFTWNAHVFVVFRFPSAGACWVFDVTTNEWAERSTYGSTDWLVSDAAQCYGKVFVQHATTGAVGYLSDTTYTEWDGILRREWTYDQVYGAHEFLRHGSLDVICRTGDAPIGTTPYLHLEVSDDGGNTWREMPRRELGLVGEYSQLIRWHRLGASRDRVYRMYVSDAIPLRVLDTQLTVE